MKAGPGQPQTLSGSCCSVRISSGQNRLLLQGVLVGLDHLLDHLATHGTGLTGGQIAVVALLQVDTDLP